ncbi:hypothetical protein [Nocardia macrotermitis]|uniref:hypothetical protein n=1 Tax=Nocardia macrotermitis TaxID=2585198 RepID=UPI001296553C|nr:hypothetical protein [Nocardia macrotermitis]
MKRSQWLNRLGIIGLCLSFISVAGCGAAPPAILKNVSTCGSLSIPTDAHLISHYADSHFRYQTVEAVVDMPASEVGEFKSRSELGDFGNGVPANWRTKYWQNIGDSSLLEQDAGNEHSPEPQYPARWVVVHNGGGDTRRVFIRAEC